MTDYLYFDIYGTSWSESLYKIVQETEEIATLNVKAYY